MKRWLACVLLFSSWVGAQSLAAKHPFTFEEMMKLKRVNEPVPSPDGKWVVFSAMHVDLAANTKTPHIWIVPADGSAKERLLIATPQGEDRPRWSPDGKYLSFTASYDGSQQIWVAAFEGSAGVITATKENLGPSTPPSAPLGMTISSVPSTANPWAHKATNISTEADGQQWSPGGKNVLFVSAVYPECDNSPDYDTCNQEKDDALAKSKVKAQVFPHLFYRHWKSYTTFKRSHLFVQPVNADGTPSGTAYDITPGDHDVPPFSLGGSDMYAWSPEGKEVAYTSNIDEVGATSTNNEIFVVPVDRAQEAGGGRQESADQRSARPPAKKISTSPGSDSTPRYSPDGKYIAFHSQARAGYESDRFRLMLYERATGKITELTKGFDRWVGSFVWNPDSKAIYFTAEERGESPIFRVGLEGGIFRLNQNHFDDLAIQGPKIFGTLMANYYPNEIAVIDSEPVESLIAKFKTQSGTQLGPYGTVSDVLPNFLTHINESTLDGVEMNGAEPFWFTGALQTKVEGFIVKPPNFDATKKYPVKFLIHGGPEGNWGDEWSYRWNAELFAANGYVVIQINPRGSTGYGQKFIDEINGDWSGKPITDLMMGLDYAIKKYPFIDGDRVCAMGASWGGYAVNWLIGHTNRFKCAVTHDGMFNTVSAYGTTEELWFPQWEFKGNPYTQLGRANYERVNPLNSVKNFKTPTLVSHGQLDYRLDLSEGLQLFTALQMQKVPSKMLYFPDEGHWVLKPQNSELWYRTVNGWVDQWVGEKKP